MMDEEARKRAFENFEPRRNAPIMPAQVDKPIVASIDITDLKALKSLAMEALVQIVKTAPRNVSLIGAIRELMDRVEGKAPQSIAMTVKQAPIESLSSDRLALLLAHCPDPLIIPPMPKKLDVDG